VLASLWGGLGTEVGKQWAARMLTPAAAFWLAGLAIVWHERNSGRIRREGWVDALSNGAESVRGLPPLVVGVLAVGGLLLVAGSTLAAEQLTLPVLRLLEGYWRRPARLRSWLVRRQRTIRENAMSRYQSLQDLRARGALDDPADELELAKASFALRASPGRPELTMPTRLGNLLRAAEARPGSKHGVDAVACWPHLWLVLPADTRAEVGQARQRLDAAVRSFIWSALFAVWAPWAWWAPVVALGAALPAYQNCLRAATAYGTLIEATFDVHLPLLYAAARMPPPPSAADAAGHGDRLTRYLRDGSDDPAVQFRDQERAGLP
jgi:hypothetical protein